MSEKRKVLITDYAWDDLTPEHEILADADAEPIVAATGEEDELIDLAPEADGILTCWKPVTERVLGAAGRCLSVGRYGIGLDNIAVSHATRLGIVVTNVPTFCLEEVGDHAMALLLSCARKVAFYDRNIKAGVYDLQQGERMHRLRGRTLGIVGLGKIGRALMPKALGFGLRVVAYDVADNASSEGVERLDFDELLATSDFISIHVPLSEETRGMFGEEQFRRMKPGAFLINTARGPVVSSTALLDALNAGEIAGAALDVFDQEPPDPDDPLIHHPRMIVTPHAAFYSEESVHDLQVTAARQMADILNEKRPENIVNPEVLDRDNIRAELR